MKRTATQRKKRALLLVDVINRFDFPGAAPLVKAARRAAPRIQALAERARRSAAPVIYVNDHFGEWRADFDQIVTAATREDSPGRAVAAFLRPERSDYFVLKPMHSGFYATALAPLLEHLGVGTVVIAGFATNYCVEFTANDAYMRGYHVVVPRDATASNTLALTRASLAHVESTLQGETPSSDAVRFPSQRSAR